MWHNLDVKRGGRILLALLGCGVAAVVTALVWPREREPEYRGKRLSKWVVSSFRPAILSDEAEVAIGQMGTNAVPFLVRWIQYQPPAWREGLAGFDIPFFEDHAADRLEGAVLAFGALGTEARVAAIPELVRLMKGTNSQVRGEASRALGGIGKEAVPVLLNLLTNGQNVDVVQAWMWLGPNAAFGVPGLIRELTNRDEAVVSKAAGLLGMETAVTNLVWLGVAGVTAHVVYEHGESNEIAQQAVEVLVRAMNNSNSIVREEATNALRQIAPQVLETHGVKGAHGQ